MNLNKIIDEFQLKEYYPIRSKKSKINFSPIKKHKYIEVCKFWYDDEENPDENTWVDVEGIGYGWLCCANKIREHFIFLQRRAIIKYAFEIINQAPDDTDVLIMADDNDKMMYGFMLSETCYVRITLSNYEFDFLD